MKSHVRMDERYHAEILTGSFKQSSKTDCRVARQGHITFCILYYDICADIFAFFSYYFPIFLLNWFYGFHDHFLHLISSSVFVRFFHLTYLISDSCTSLSWLDKISKNAH